ncbi:MAG: hypothetical protein ABI203_05185, partial [Mucilaginibacter sp.]
MADDINKKISVQVEMNTDGLQQIGQYKTAFDSLRGTIGSLGKPLEETAKSIAEVSSAAAEAGTAVGKAIKSTTQNTESTSKSIFSKILSLFVKTESDKSAAAITATTKTNAAIEKAATALQQKI